jgi:exopolysaccharide production protein ExoQ
MRNSVQALQARPAASSARYQHASSAHASARTAAPPSETAAALFSVEWWCACVGITAITLVPKLGDLAVGVFLICTITTFARHISASARTLFHFAPILAFPALAYLSYMWSDAPDITKKQSAEIILYFAATLVLCRPLRLREMAAALQAGTLVCCALCLALQPSALKGGAALVGLLQSKNSVAFIAQILLLSSLAVASDGRMPRVWRVLALASAALAALEIHLAQSAGGLISTVAAVTAFAGLAMIGRLALSRRMAIVIGLVVSVSPLLVVAKDVVEQVQDFQVHVLHKDATLTGRTELWTFAQSLISEKPTLGHGASAFWRPGNEDAEGLWQRYGIGTRMGFNFHNQFVEAQVDLGIVGLVVLIVTLAGVAVPSIWRAIAQPSLGNALATALLIALYVKLPVESILIGSWNIYSLVLITVALGALAASPHPASHRQNIRRSA